MIKLQKTKVVYHSDEIPLDIGFSLIGLRVLKPQYNQNCPFLVQSHISDFKNRAFFSATSVSLNDVNVRGGNVIKPFA